MVDEIQKFHEATMTPVDAVWVHGQLVPKDQLAAFLKQPSAVPCKWRPAFRRGGCE